MAETSKTADNQTVKVVDYDKPEKFPYTDADSLRLEDYFFYQQLFEGAHYEGFKQKIRSEDFNKAYAKLRYLYMNFAGTISRIVADMLFGEPVKPRVENEKVQAWLEDFWRENYLDILLYESALGNSALGDELFKLRTGARVEGKQENEAILEQSPPSIYFPHINPFNVGAEPRFKELAWKFKDGNDDYLRREIHEPGRITNQIFKLKGDKVEDEVPEMLTKLGLVATQETGIDRHMLIHIPNWKIGSRHFGYSDYHDLDALFFAINNRFSKVDNVLDKHTDPILMVPPGVIDDKTGKVKKDARVIEMGEGDDGKPEYIVWDASLENAFKELDALIEAVQMVGEVSPDVFGMGKGQSDSGRALKYKLLRIIAKVTRKKLYYDRGIKEALFVAQLLAKENGATAGGNKFEGEPEMPELIWQDGLPADEIELIDNEIKKIDAGITTDVAAIMKIHSVDEDTAKAMAEEIKKENEAKMPAPLDPSRNPFNDPKQPPSNDDGNK